MIAYLKGELIAVSEEQIVVEVSNIGYNVFVSAKTIGLLPVCGSKIQIHTYTCVREDAFLLYGFLTTEELELFRLLLTVNGIGPKGALSILSVIGYTELQYAILAGDDKLIAKSPGIGLKTAQRLILELKNKITIEEFNSTTIQQEHTMAREEVTQALMALGYSASDILKGMKKITIDENMETEEILKLVLKKMI
ncbi:MAG: Holliday junction branch migration protein RuvA [Eubacteriales bacterium]